MTLIFGPLERPLLRGLHVDECPAAAVACPSRKAKGRRASSERVSNRRTTGNPNGKGVSDNMSKSTLHRAATGDPLLGLVEDRFRLLRRCPACEEQNDEAVFDRRLDEIRRRIRRLDERIIRTVATSTPGLLAQLRLLAAFYEESANGAGRRGCLLIQAIAEGVTQLEGRKSPPPTIAARMDTLASAGGREW